jgi:hypothetical protein
MARYKNTEEAVADLTQKIKTKRTEVANIGDTSDAVLKKRAEAAQEEINKLSRQLYVAQLGNKGVRGQVEAAVLGGATGLPRLFTSVVDLAAQGGEKLSKLLPEVPGTLTPRKDYLLTPRVLPGVEVTTPETALAFGAGQGAATSMFGGPVVTAIGATTGAIDERIFEGAPVTSLVTALGALGYGGVRGISNYRDAKSFNKFLEQLGPAESNRLRQFMVSGQESKDPLIAGTINKLRNNPKFAEFFTELEKGATKKVLSGMTPEAKEGKIAEPVYNAYKEQIARLYDGMFGKGVSTKFEKATQLAGDRTIPVNQTADKIDKLIQDFSAVGTDSSKASIAYLERFKTRLLGTPDSVGYLPKETTIQKLQGNLSSFGAEAAGQEGMLRNVAKNDQQAIAKALFGSLKDDLGIASKTTTDKQLKAATNLLESARNDVKNGYEELNKFRARGLPKVFKDKEIYEFADEDLIKAFKGLNAKELQQTRAILEVENPDALARVQKNIYEDFVSTSRNTLPDNTSGVDLQKLVARYNSLPKNEQETLAFALGSNSKEFGERMADAQRFFNYSMKSGGVLPSGQVNPAIASEAAFASTGGSYTGGKVGGVTARLFNYFKGELNDDQVFKLLLTPEGKDFLKSSSLSPNAAKNLEKLTKVQSATSPALSTTLSAGARANIQENEVGVSPQTQGAAPTQRPDLDLSIPDTEAAPAGPTTPTTPTVAPGGRPDLDLSYNPADIETQIRAEAEKQGLGNYADLFVRQAKQESSYNPYAVSKVGAQGVFQLMPGTAQELGVTDPFDVNQNISGGIRYMGQQLKRFNDPALALAAYNAGPSRVASAGGIPNIPETQDYVKKILGI